MGVEREWSCGGYWSEERKEVGLERSWWSKEEGEGEENRVYKEVCGLRMEGGEERRVWRGKRGESKENFAA